MLVAAVGALIDQANGGRLHPEQWLGAAAVVCGVGLVAGAFAGRALWLAVPAVLFAGTGFAAGEAARIGVHPTSIFGDEFDLRRQRRSGWRDSSASTSLSAGSRSPSMGRRSRRWPSTPASASARSTCESPATSPSRCAPRSITAPSTSTECGGATARSRSVPRATPDVVVTAIVGRGDLRSTVRVEGPPMLPSPRPRRPRTRHRGVADRSGDFVLADGEAVIERRHVLAGSATTRIASPSCGPRSASSSSSRRTAPHTVRRAARHAGVRSADAVDPRRLTVMQRHPSIRCPPSSACSPSPSGSSCSRRARRVRHEAWWIAVAARSSASPSSRGGSVRGGRTGRRSLTAID